jgi:hypothetical protein
MLPDERPTMYQLIGFCAPGMMMMMMMMTMTTMAFIM